jgi:putative membrane-bound dehydrogenase-like protein
MIPSPLLVLIALVTPIASDLPKFPRTPPTEAKAAEATFRGQRGFKLDLLAAEPLVMDPVAAAYDEDGRLYVVEMSDYPYVDKKNDLAFAENKLDPPIGRLKLLTDSDGDGRFDTSTILADKLSWPTGLAVWKGGVFVAATPTIWYIKDTNGDGRADIKERVYEGFRKFNIQAVMNNLQWGLDHQIYGAASGNGGEVKSVDKPAMRSVSVLRHDFRFQPVTRSFEAISGGARFGNTFDNWGNRFLCDIRNPAEHVVLPSKYLARNPRLTALKALHDVAEAGDTIPMFRISPPEPWREFRAKRWAANGKVLPRSELVGAGYLTSSSGVTIYRGDAYPQEYQGQIFLGEVANNLIHRESIEPGGVTFKAKRADTGVEFLGSTDPWFRPVNFVNAPDGTLHVLDMYRETIEHPWSIPDDIKAELDLRSGEDKGRIYRLTPPHFKRRPSPKLSHATTSELVELLAHPNAWHRDTAHRLLFERQDPAAIPLLRNILRSSPEPLAKLHALWSLEGMKSLTLEDLTTTLKDSDPRVAEHAIALSDRYISGSRELMLQITQMARHPVPRVRFQVAFTLGELPKIAPEAVKALAAIVKQDAGDPWISTALLSAPPAFAIPLFDELVSDLQFTLRPEGLNFLRELGKIVGSDPNLKSSTDLLDTIAHSPFAESPIENVTEVTLGLAEGLAHTNKSLRDLPPLKAATTSLLQAMLASAPRIATEQGATLTSRERAITMLGYDKFEQSYQVLTKLLNSSQPQIVQLAAMRSLTGYSQPQVGEILLKAWPGAGPALRGDIITRLLARPTWKLQLLDAIDAKVIPASMIPPNRRMLLLADRDPKVRAMSKKLFADETTGSRADAYSRYKACLTLPVNMKSGEAIFVRECMTCHKLGPRGNMVGPNLSSIRRKTAEEVLLHVIDPNREVAPDFIEYNVSLRDGRTLSGLIASETANSVTLRRAEGVEETVLRTNIEAIASTGKSLMPEGMETRIKPQEMADLLAFLLELQK